MNEVSIIINGVRYDAVEDVNHITSEKCDLYDKKRECFGCIIGWDGCENLLGENGIFKKSTKSFER